MAENESQTLNEMNTTEEKTVEIFHRIHNTTGKYLLCGNASEVIAAYDTHAEAEADIDNQAPCIDDSKWGCIRVLAPGDSWEANLVCPRPWTQAEEAQEIDWSHL